MENITIQPWTTQSVDSISVTIFEHDMVDNDNFDEDLYYTAELAFFLEAFDGEDVDQDPEAVQEKVVILATDLGGYNYNELIYHTITGISILYPSTYISPIVYVLALNEDGTDREIDIIDLSEEMYPEEIEQVKQPLMKM